MGNACYGKEVMGRSGLVVQHLVPTMAVKRRILLIMEMPLGLTVIQAGEA